MLIIKRIKHVCEIRIETFSAVLSEPQAMITPPVQLQFARVSHDEHDLYGASHPFHDHLTFASLPRLCRSSSLLVSWNS